LDELFDDELLYEFDELLDDEFELLFDDELLLELLFEFDPPSSSRSRLKLNRPIRKSICSTVSPDCWAGWAGATARNAAALAVPAVRVGAKAVPARMAARITALKICIIMSFYCGLRQVSV
jgi:hypothetical protein